MRSIILILGVVFAFGAKAAPLGSEFTFQGQLQESGFPADGSYDFEFEPFDAETGGISFAPTLPQTLQVDDGIFTTQLDFGDGPFMGDAVWLEVRVRPSGGGAFTVLSPRQPLTAAPYAMHARFVDMDSITGVEIADGSVAAPDIDQSQVQRRIAGVCMPGSAISTVSIDGSVSCEPTGDSDWLPLEDGRIQSEAGIRVQTDANTLFPVTVRHDSTIPSSHISITETTPNDYARFSFYNDNNFSRHWTIAARVLEGDVSGDVLNFYNAGSDDGAGADILSIRGNKRVGINNRVPATALHVSQGILRVDDLAHAGPQPRALVASPEGELQLGPESTVNYLSLGSAAFRPDSNVDFTMSDLTYPAFSEAVMLAPLNLPNGASITQITVYVVDNSSIGQLAAHFRAYALNNRMLVTEVSDSANFNQGPVQSFTLTFSPPFEIDNSSHSHVLAIDPSGQAGGIWSGTDSMGIVGASIAYTH